MRWSSENNKSLRQRLKFRLNLCLKGLLNVQLPDNTERKMSLFREMLSVIENSRVDTISVKVTQKALNAF